MLHVSCKFGNYIQKIKVKATILIKDTKKRLTMKKVHSHTLEGIVSLRSLFFTVTFGEMAIALKVITL